MRCLMPPVLVAGIAAGLLLATAAQGHSQRCAVDASTALARSDDARVYRHRGGVFGCAMRTGRHVRLGLVYRPAESTSGGGGITRLRLSGRFVAVVNVSEDASGGRMAGVEVVNLVTRSRVFTWTAGAESNLSLDADITDVVVDRAGRVAFIQGFIGPARGERPRRLIVRRHDSRGNAVLEDSPTIRPVSLSASGRTVRWRSGSSVRSATLR